MTKPKLTASTADRRNDLLRASMVGIGYPSSQLPGGGVVSKVVVNFKEVLNVRYPDGEVFRIEIKPLGVEG